MLIRKINGMGPLLKIAYIFFEIKMLYLIKWYNFNYFLDDFENFAQ